MINNSDYVRLSLELHLFFARIMKEHSLFLEMGFTQKDMKYKKIANDFQVSFNELLDKIVKISNNNISEEVILSQEIVTDNTLLSENKTSYLTGIMIDDSITKRELNLKSGMPNGDVQMIAVLDEINKQSLPLIESLINFKNDILNRVLECQMYTMNYPLLITHIMNEAKMYYNLVHKLLHREKITEREMYEQEMFWNKTMKEHAEFIRGLLDPTEEKLILTANGFAGEYNKILENYKSKNFNLNSISLQKTIEFKNFKVAGEIGILNCKIKSIIIPLLADHVVREANYFIRLLNLYSKDSNQLFRL